MHHPTNNFPCFVFHIYDYMCCFDNIALRVVPLILYAIIFIICYQLTNYKYSFHKFNSNTMFQIATFIRCNCNNLFFGAENVNPVAGLIITSHNRDFLLYKPSYNFNGIHLFNFQTAASPSRLLDNKNRAD